MSLSNEHAFLQQIVEENLDKLDLLFPMLRDWLPADAGEARLVRAEFQETRPMEARADIVVTYGEPPTYCVVIEIQRAKDAAKPDAWLAYRKHALRAYDCPVALLVVSPRRRVITWAREAWAEREAMLLPPVFVGPEEFAAVIDGDIEQVGISVATFWAYFQRANPEGEALLNAIWQQIRAAIQSGALAEDILADYIDRLETAATRGWLQRVMERDMEYIGFAERHRREGLREGVAKGRQEGRQEGREEGLREGVAVGTQKGALEATLKLAERLAPELLDELRAIDNAEKAQARLVAHLEKTRG